jgi:hypothetical protein
LLWNAPGANNVIGLPKFVMRNELGPFGMAVTATEPLFPAPLPVMVKVSAWAAAGIASAARRAMGRLKTGQADHSKPL